MGGPEGPEDPGAVAGAPSAFAGVTRGPVDPRIAARREAVEVDELRRRRLRLLTVVALAVTLVAGVLATRTPLFDVDRIVVAGSVETPPDAVVAAARVSHGDLLVDVDPGRAAHGVEALPWVDAARVRAVWPDSVVIEVAERSPSAVVTDGEVTLVVDGAGRVLARRDGRSPEAIRIEGLPAVDPGDVLSDEVRAAISLAGMLPSRVRDRTAAVALRDGELRLRLEPSGEVRMGEGGSLDQKLLALDTLLLRVDDTCLDTIDVRVPSAPVLTRDPSCDKVSTEIRG